MALTPFVSEIYGGLFATEEIGRHFTDAAEIDAILRFEAALAEAQSEVGIIPREAGPAIAAALKPLSVRAGNLAAATRTAGMPVPQILALVRATLPAEIASWVHHGATSQDAMDTGLMLRLEAALDLTENKLSRLRTSLAALADRHRHVALVARTRNQQAAPTSLGLKIAGWLDPMNRLAARILEARRTALAVQCGGAVGNLAHMGPRGLEVMERLAQKLGLAPALPWHSARDRIECLGDLYASLATAAGKPGADILAMAQSEVAEVALGSSGGSSTLPHKQNPVDAEMLVTLARFAAGQAGALRQATLPVHERDGAAWTLEWFVLPQLAVAAHSSVSILSRLIDGLAFRTDCMADTVHGGGGLVFAEAARFALARHMPKDQAEALVKRVVAEGRGVPDFDLVGALSVATDAPVDWATVRDPASQFGAVDAIIDRILADAPKDH